MCVLCYKLVVSESCRRLHCSNFDDMTWLMNIIYYVTMVTLLFRRRTTVDRVIDTIMTDDVSSACPFDDHLKTRGEYYARQVTTSVYILLFNTVPSSFRNTLVYLPPPPPFPSNTTHTAALLCSASRDGGGGVVIGRRFSR